MNNFSKDRFARYAKWDLTINKTFYRNMFIVMAIAYFTVTAIAFFIRWGFYSLEPSSADFIMPQQVAIWLVAIFTIATHIMAGCTLHPLRNKQGRISQLTLPATNLEKYLWHVLICMGGTLVVSIIAIVLCDGIQALATLAAMGSENVHSLSSHIFTTDGFQIEATFNKIFMPMDPAHYSITYSESLTPHDTIMSNVSTVLWFWLFCASFFETSLYAFGNGLKYKYNLPITYIILQVISFLITICIIVAFIIISNNYDGNFNENFNQISFLNGCVAAGWICNVMSIILGLLFWYYSYRLYTKAEITNKLNR